MDANPVMGFELKVVVFCFFNLQIIKMSHSVCCLLVNKKQNTDLTFEFGLIYMNKLLAAAHLCVI